MSYKLLDIPNNITQISYKHNYNIDDSIQRIFPNDMFSTSKNKSPLNGYLKIYVRDRFQKNCIIFTIEKDLIYVDELTKCSSGSGTELLYKVEQFAIEMGIFKITLLDASKITTPCKNVDVSLKMLSILTTGKSWYNKLGYVSGDQDEIDSHNNLIIQMKFSDFIDTVHANIENKYPNELIKFETLIDNLIRQTDINFESTVQKVFIKIKDMLKLGQPCLPDIEPHLVSLIMYINMSNILLIPPPYKTVLTKTLQPHDIGKGTKRKGTMKKRTKKQKRTKTNKFLRKKLR